MVAGAGVDEAGAGKGEEWLVMEGNGLKPPYLVCLGRHCGCSCRRVEVVEWKLLWNASLRMLVYAARSCPVNASSEQ